MARKLAIILIVPARLLMNIWRLRTGSVLLCLCSLCDCV